MWFIDWLSQLCDIKEKVITKDDYWKEIETLTTKYENIKCRLWKLRNKYNQNSNTQVDDIIYSYKVYTLLENWWVSRWNYILISDRKFKIIWWQEGLWRFWEANHYIYDTEEVWIKN